MFSDHIHYSPSSQDLDELMEKLKDYGITIKEVEERVKEFSRACFVGSFNEINRENIEEIKNLTLCSFELQEIAKL